MFYKIYKLTNNINNKIYFGYTQQTLNKRFSGHIAEPRDTIISRSIRKHGKEHFTMEQLFETENETEAKVIEKFLIAHHQTNIIKYPNGNGMNMTDGGEGATGYKHSEEQKEKWSKERKGKNTGKENPKYRIPTKDNPQCKKVHQFTLDGKLIASFPSAKDAAIANNTYGANISKCCRGITKTTKGYIFSYSPDFKSRDLTKKNHTQIQQCTTEGELVNTFNSIAEAVRELSLPDRSCIDKCLMHSHKTAYGFIWKRA